MLMVIQELQQSQTKRQEASIISKRNLLMQFLEREMNSSRIPLGVDFEAKVTNVVICRTLGHQISLGTM